jgi:hypothetical protein
MGDAHVRRWTAASRREAVDGLRSGPAMLIRTAILRLASPTVPSATRRLFTLRVPPVSHHGIDALSIRNIL